MRCAAPPRAQRPPRHRTTVITVITMRGFTLGLKSYAAAHNIFLEKNYKNAFLCDYTEGLTSIQENLKNGPIGMSTGFVNIPMRGINGDKEYNGMHFIAIIDMYADPMSGDPMLVVSA